MTTDFRTDGVEQDGVERSAGSTEREDLEVDLLVTAILRLHGLDFSDYSRPSLTRRLRKAAELEGGLTLTGLLERVIHDDRCMARVMASVSVNVTAMFRDPSFYLALRKVVVPYLETYPYIRIWVAGCASGEEVYSLAIVLREAGLIDRCRIYATDMNAETLEVAREGIFPINAIKEYTRNYIEGGGTEDFASYYTARYERARLDPSLRKGVLFSTHNLVTDASFNEFHLILCRNVMIYFNPELQNKVHGLLFSSLRRLGILCIGRRETLRGTAEENSYLDLAGEERIFQRVR